MDSSEKEYKTQTICVQDYGYTHKIKNETGKKIKPAIIFADIIELCDSDIFDLRTEKDLHEFEQYVNNIFGDYKIAMSTVSKANIYEIMRPSYQRGIFSWISLHMKSGSGNGLRSFGIATPVRLFTVLERQPKQTG